MWVIYAGDAQNSKWTEEPDLGEKDIELLVGYLDSEVFVVSTHPRLLFASLVDNNAPPFSSPDFHTRQVRTLLPLTAVIFPLFLPNLCATVTELQFTIYLLFIFFLVSHPTVLWPPVSLLHKMIMVIVSHFAREKNYPRYLLKTAKNTSFKMIAVRVRTIRIGGRD